MSLQLVRKAGFRGLHVALSAAGFPCDRFVSLPGYPGTKELHETAFFYAERKTTPFHANFACPY